MLPGKELASCQGLLQTCLSCAQHPGYLAIQQGSREQVLGPNLRCRQRAIPWNQSPCQEGPEHGINQMHSFRWGNDASFLFERYLTLHYMNIKHMHTSDTQQPLNAAQGITDMSTHLSIRADLSIWQIWVNLLQNGNTGINQPPAGPAVTSQRGIGLSDHTGLEVIHRAQLRRTNVGARTTCRMGKLQSVSPALQVP